MGHVGLIRGESSHRIISDIESRLILGTARDEERAVFWHCLLDKLNESFIKCLLRLLLNLLVIDERSEHLSHMKNI